MPQAQRDLAPSDINGIGQENVGAGEVNSCHSGMRQPNSGLPESGNIIIQVGNSRLGCAGPESILLMVVMDSGLARFTRALRRANRRVGE